MKRFVVILIILALGVFLTGCCYTCCGGYVTPPVQPQCSLTVTAGYWVWGTVYINGQSTGQYIDFESNTSTTIANVPCNQQICVIIVDPCGAQSHAEWVCINSGQNYLYFAYW
jgi:hypothetical protein